jgi:hypothetical protein
MNDRAELDKFAARYAKAWCSQDPENVFEIAAGDGTTNVAFGEGEKELYVTVVKDPKDSQAKGSIVKISNVK